jgi:hypothetical protein
MCKHGSEKNGRTQAWKRLEKALFRNLWDACDFGTVFFGEI